MTELSARELIDVIVRSLRETARRFSPKRKRTVKKHISPTASTRLSRKKKPKKRKPAARRHRA